MGRQLFDFSRKVLGRQLFPTFREKWWVGNFSTFRKKCWAATFRLFKTSDGAASFQLFEKCRQRSTLRLFEKSWGDPAFLLVEKGCQGTTFEQSKRSGWGPFFRCLEESLLTCTKALLCVCVRRGLAHNSKFYSASEANQRIAPGQVLVSTLLNKNHKRYFLPQSIRNLRSQVDKQKVALKSVASM